MKLLALFFGLVSAGAGVASAFAFLFGSRAMPWGLQTWDGKSEKEKAFRATAECWNRRGIFFLLAAFFLSAFASIFGYYS